MASLLSSPPALLVSLLVPLLARLPGGGGEEEGVSLYSTVGGSVNMSCQGSRDHQKYYFEWLFHHKSEVPVKIVNSEQQITVRDPERAQRMSVGSDWSLHIHNLHTQDTGQYLCQHINGQYFFPGRTTVDLYLLSISASPSGGLKTDTILTLQCGLDCGGGFQSCAGEPADVQVTWESDHMEKVDISQDRYFSSLSMKLQSSDHMRNWTCVLTERGVMKTSDTYTIHLTDVRTGDIELSPDSGDVGPKAYTTAPPREASDDHFLEKTSAAGAGTFCALLVVLVVVFLLMKRRRRGGRRMASAGPGVCVTTEEDLIVYASPTEPTEQTSPAPGGDEVNYASVTFKDKERGRSGQAGPEDGAAIIYSNLRR